jgi:hypothetical protein
MNNLTEAQIERLAKLAEEATEVAQACMKILRFGFVSSHPACPETNNRENLAKELGDFRAAMTLLVQAKELHIWEYQHFAIESLDSIQKYMVHQENVVLAQDALDIHNSHG